MDIGKVINQEKESAQSSGFRFTSEEMKRLTDVFAILIDIDQRNKRKEALKNEKSDKWNPNYPNQTS